MDGGPSRPGKFEALNALGESDGPKKNCHRRPQTNVTTDTHVSRRHVLRFVSRDEHCQEEKHQSNIHNTSPVLGKGEDRGCTNDLSYRSIRSGGDGGGDNNIYILMEGEKGSLIHVLKP